MAAAPTEYWGEGADTGIRFRAKPTQSWGSSCGIDSLHGLPGYGTATSSAPTDWLLHLGKECSSGVTHPRASCFHHSSPLPSSGWGQYNQSSASMALHNSSLQFSTLGQLNIAAPPVPTRDGPLHSTHSLVVSRLVGLQSHPQPQSEFH